MTNEATLIFETGPRIPFTCANATAIEKGTLLASDDPFTAIAAATPGEVIAGIAAAEKIASDGNTHIPVYREGIFKMTASGAISDGCTLKSASDANYPNTVAKADGLALSGACLIGIALETATDGQTFLVDFGIGKGGNMAVS